MWATDTAGNTESHETVEVWIDTTAPGQPQLDPLSGWTDDDTPTVSWNSVTDGASGVDHYEIRVDGGSWQDVGTSTSYTLSLSSGTHTVEVRAVDQAGNTGSSDSETVRVDTQSPDTTASLSGTAGNNPWYVSTDVTVTLSADDDPAGDNSGVAETRYRVNGGTYTTGTSTTVSGDGTHTVEFYSVDTAGNTESTNTRTVKIDSTPPGTPNPNTPSSWTSDTTVSWSSVSDATSGVDHYEVRIDSGSWTSVGTSTSYDASALADGTHTIDVRAIDVAGNAGSDGSTTLKLDTTGPTSPGPVDGPTGWIADTSTSISWSSATDADSGVDHYMVQVGSGTPTNVGTSTQTTVTGLSSGENTISVWAVDNAGNTGTKATTTIKVDLNAPSLSIASPANESVTNQSSITVDGTVSDANGGVQSLEVSSNGGSYTTIATSDGSWSYTWSSLTEGENTLTLRATDTASNTRTTTLVVTSDTVAPGTPNPTGPTGWTNDSTPTVTWSAVSDTTSSVDHYEVRIDGGTWQAVATTSFTPSTALSDGTHTIDVRAVDTAQNTGSAGTVQVKVDTTAPPAPSTVSGPSGWISQSSATISWDSVTDADSGVDHYMIQVGSNSPQNVGTNTQTTLTGLQTGVNTISVWAVDTAGNAGPTETTTVKIDVTPPGLSIASPANESATNQSSITVDGSLSDPDAGVQSLEVSSNGGSYTTIATSAGSWSYTWSSLTEGENTLTLRATDTASNTQTTTLVVTSDTVAPGTPNPTGPTGWTNDSTPTVTWSAVTDTTSTVDHYEVRIDGGSWQAVTTTSFTPATALADGTHTVDVRAVDSASNTGSAGSTQLQIDTTAPPAPSSVSSPSGWISQSSATISWSGVTDAVSGVDTYEVKVDNGGWQSVGTSTSETLTGLSPGTHTIRVRARDAANNAGPAAQTTVKIDLQSPDVTNLAPSNGAIINSSAVTIQGSVSDSPAGVQVLEISEDGGNTWTTVTNSGGSWTYDWTSLSTGSQSLQIRATDAAGNTRTITYTLTVDLSGPPMPTLSAPSGWVDTAGPTVDWQPLTDSTTSLDYYEVRVDGSSWNSVSSSAFTPSLSDGTHTVEVRGVDAAGNAGPAASTTLKVDTTAPSAPSTLSGPSGWTNNTAPTLSWASVTDSTSHIDHYEMRADGGSWVDVGMSTSAAHPDPFADGTHTVGVRAVDAAGNAGASVSTTLKIDTTLPSARVLEPTSGDVVKNSSTMVTGTASDSPAGISAVRVSPDNGTTWTTVATTSGNWTYQWTNLTGAKIFLQIEVVDLAGNVNRSTFSLNRLFATPITMPNGMAIGPPEDLNGDDVYKDIDGNGARCPTDVDKLRMIVKAYQGDMRGPALDLNQLEIDALDVDGDGKLTMDDVQALERQIGRSGGRQCLGA